MKQRTAIFTTLLAVFFGGALAALLSFGIGSAFRLKPLPGPVVKTEKTSAPQTSTFGAREACAVLGFRYDPDVPEPMPKCVPQTACFAGGAFVLTYGALTCQKSNPATNACSCPKGFTDLPVGSVNMRNISCGKDCAITVADTVHHCQYCPP